MPHIVLFQPEIPPNTGNIIRLCHNCGFKLHLIRPLGFEIEDTRLRRAGLDYIEWQNMEIHQDWNEYLTHFAQVRKFAISTKGKTNYSSVKFLPEDHLLFGPETRGLPQFILDELPSQQVLRIPMQADSRSLNLSNAAAILAYEAWRQLNFAGAL